METEATASALPASIISAAKRLVIVGELDDILRRAIKRTFLILLAFALVWTGLLVALRAIIGPPEQPIHSGWLFVIMNVVIIGPWLLVSIVGGVWLFALMITSLPHQLDIVPAKGVRWWVGLGAIDALADTYRITASDLWVSEKTHELAIVFMTVRLLIFLIALFVCLWWYSRSRLHRRRSPILQIAGFVLFAVGTISTTDDTILAISIRLVKFHGATFADALPNATYIAMSGSEGDYLLRLYFMKAAAIFVSYFLVFRRMRRVRS
jgi:hypothetical protein